jgi:hypothetical protein
MQGETPNGSAPLKLSLPPEPFGREEASRAPRYGSLRLQPVVLGPPPDPKAVDVTAADDIDPIEYREKPRTGLFAGVIAALAVLSTVGAAYWTLRPIEDAALPAPPVPNTAAPAAPVLPSAPVTQAEERPVITPVPQASPVDMARVDSDLVPPSTEGLTPARRIQTIRIVVENDREIAVPR